MIVFYYIIYYCIHNIIDYQVSGGEAYKYVRLRR